MEMRAKTRRRKHFFVWLISSVLILFQSHNSFAQKGSTTVGIQLRTLLPFTVSGNNKVVSDTGGVHFEREIVGGYSFGLTIRHNFTNLIAIETGINYGRRKYDLRISEGDFKDDSEFRIISYEIPIHMMVYARVGERMYVNVSLGPTLDMFASHIETYDTNFIHVGYRNYVFMPAIAANIGAEYRTQKSGAFYFGLSFQRPFEYIYLSRVQWEYNRPLYPIINDAELTGSYFALDFRYYFPDSKRRTLPEE
jgi:hypothetical protein